MMHHQRVPIRLGKVSTRLKTSSGNDLIQPSGPGKRICKSCTSQYARYTCPRCNAPYCSADCYKKHGTHCTELFFRQHVQDEMQLEDQKTPTKAAMKKKMQQILLKAHQEHNQDAPHDPLAEFEWPQDQDQAAEAQAQVDMLERLQQLALLDDEQLTLECLDEPEKAQFLKDLNSGQLSRFVAVWKPWWLQPVDEYAQQTKALRKPLIEEVLVMPAQSDHHEDAAPPVLTIESLAHPVQVFTDALRDELPSDLSRLLGGKAPSELLQFNLIEVLFAYVVVLKAYNGDWRADPTTAACDVLTLSSVLTDNAKFGSVKKVVLSCLPKRLENDFACAIDTTSSFRALRDVVSLLQAKTFLVDALSDLHALFKAAKQVASGSCKVRKSLTASSRKVFFLLAYAFHQDNAWGMELAASVTRQMAAIQLVSCSTNEMNF